MCVPACLLCSARPESSPHACTPQVVLWFDQTFPFASDYAASWAAAHLDGEALLMLDDEGLRDDIPIGVRAHRAAMLKKIDGLRAQSSQ